MSKYSYRAVNEAGRPVRGIISAANETELVQLLEESGMALVDCKAIGEKHGKISALKAKRIKIPILIQLFVHLEQLQKAGVPLLGSLADVRDTTESDALRDVMSDVYKEVSEGNSLSSALGKHPTVFEEIFIALISAGEETGNLQQSFAQVVRHLKWTFAMRTKIKKATRYPKILLSVVIMVVYVMMSYVVPQVTGFLLDMGRELPPVTLALMATSNFFAHHSLKLFAAIIAVFIFLKVGRALSDDFKFRTDYIALNAPVMGPLIRKISLSQFSRTFGILFISGVEIMQCLETARKTAVNLVMMEALGLVKQRVQEGSSLSEAMKVSGEFPSLVVRMLKVGEESGNLTEVLDQVSEFYDHDVNEAIEGMIAMIEPILTGVLGILILWIAAAVFGPIYDSLGEITK